MRKRIDFLEQLFKKLQCRTEILQFLRDEKLISDDLMQTILHENHLTHTTKIAMLLNDLVKEEKLQLVDYEWTVLPKEFLKLTIVSAEDKKEFFYSV